MVINMKLSEGKKKKEYQILTIDLPKDAKKRLSHVGIYEGAKLRIEKQGGRGRPTLLLVCGNFLMMRSVDVAKIDVVEV